MCRKFCAHSKLWAVLSLLTLSFYACQSDGQKQEKQESVTETPQIITDTVAVDTLVKATKVEQKDTLEKETELMQHAAKDTIKLKSKADSTSPRYIYLTFDDGPLIGSQAIDSIATAKQIKVNAFVVGKHAGMSKKLQKYFQRYMDNPYVDIYNHSFTHANNKFNVFYSHPQQAFEDFEKNENTLGLSHKIVRLPGRNKYIYLTFDDGPLIGSQAIDSIATAKQIKVNAFVVGKHAGMSKKLQKYFQRYMDNPYVDIYNHSFTHANNKFNVFYSHPQQAFEDFEKMLT